MLARLLCRLGWHAGEWCTLNEVTKVRICLRCECEQWRSV
jgi:hypothetical protein